MLKIESVENGISIAMLIKKCYSIGSITLGC